MKTFKLFNFNRRTAMVQADGCTAARQKIGVNPRGTSTFGRFVSILCLILTMLFTLGVGQMWAADTNLTDGSILYCNVDNSNWRGDNAVMKFNFQFNDDGWDSRKGTNISGTNIWYCKVPANVKYVQMLRCNPSGWGQWNYSNGVNVSARSSNSQNLVTISGGNYDGAAIAWGSYTPTKKTIHVHVPEGWSSPKLYTWFTDPDSNNQTTNGNWPGTNGSGQNGQSISNTSGNWYDVTIAVINPNFIIAKDGDTKTNDLTYSGITNGEYYVATASSTLTAVTKPTVTSSAASSVTYSSAVFNGNVTAMGNDPDISSYGFYWSSSSFTTADVSGCTKVDLGSKTSTGAFTHTATGLSAETTYYFVSYATNHKGTSYGTVRNFTTEEAPVVPTLTLDAVSPSSMVSGNDVTITTTRSNTTNAITFEYTTNNGSTWTSLTPKSTSNSGQTAVWTIPEAHGATQTYKFRAKITADALTTDASSGVTVYGKKTIKVKNTNGWDTFNSYVYDYSAGKTTAKREEWPGSTTGVSPAGGQWKQVVLTSQYTYFILNDGGISEQLSGETYTYASSVTDGGSYAIGGSGSTCTLSSATPPSAPTSITTSAASNLTNTTARINGNIGGNGNDNITDYGFYWSKDYSTAADLQSSGTKVQKGTSNYTGNISEGLTSLTANTTYYYIVYATNGQGTTLSSVQNFTTPYKVTITKPTGCASMTPGTGTQYVKVGDNITATAATGYTFSSWSTTNLTLGTPSTTDGVTTSSITAISADNGTITATYTENMATVTLAHTGNGHIEISGATVTETTAGVTTKPTITAVPDAGWYFAGWVVAAGSDCSVASTAGRDDNASSSTTLSGLGAGTTGTVTAKFMENEKIYFRNIFTDGSTTTRWSNVYAFLDYTWDGTKVHTNSNSSYKLAMTKIGLTDVYWAYIPRAFTVSNHSKIAFSDTDFATNYTFYNVTASGSKGAARGDYNKALNMFVPFHTPNTINDNGVDYYSNGYWMKYDTKASTGAGYYFKQYNSRNDYTQKGEFIATNDDATFIQFKLRIDAANTYRGYMITSAGGLNYVADDTITAAKCTNVGVSENTSSLSSTDVKFMLLTTSEGEYTFILDQSGDKMKLSVIYPVTVGDYILENAYTDGSAKTTHSNIIKAADAATKTRYSMFLSNKGAGATLKLRKCTAVSAAGVPTWSEGDETKLSSILSDGKFTPGVYQFDITIADDKVATIDSVRLYTGDFYIKTDAAPGGWITYTQNIMDKNTVTFDRTSATFDNYWCHYYSTDADNIKCVIANDYCNQLSDTLKGDDISRMSGTEPYVPKDKTSIRFSYNSATNTIARAYLKSQDDDDYLDIEPFEAGYVYNTSSEDLKGAGDNKRRFTDNGDWIYEKDLKVYPGAKAGVSATYKDASGVDHVQTLLPTSNTVLGGTKGENQYDIRVVYDFKTNYMMSSFILPKDDEIEDNLTDVDMLWVRHKDESADQLLLGDGISLSKVSVVGAIELKYNEMNKNSTSGSKVDLSEWNETSRPYLKYFISFPFEVPVNSIFGLNQAELGREYIIQKYNGAKRAKEGLFGGDDDNYWENLTKDSVMHANEGYCVIFDNDYARGLYGHIWDNKSSGSSVYLYFPAKDTIKSITNSNQTILVDSLHCRVNRAWANNAEKNHMQTDSHWHLIGSPLFHDSYIKSRKNLDTFQLRSYYKLDYSDNKWKAVAITEGSTLFKAMSSVMVQWYGEATWTTDAPASAPVRTSAPTKNYLVQLDLSYNGKTPDWTYVQLQDGANDDFVLREDMYKMYNSGIPQIYTFAGAYDVAYNGVPEKNQTIPVGVLISKNGTYTFSMPTTFSGTVTLIDKFAQTRTDLSIDDYTVELEKGNIDDRFELEINIQNVVTSLENENGNNVLNDGGVHKFIKDDNMYILRNGVIYDAQGRKVK